MHLRKAMPLFDTFADHSLVQCRSPNVKQTLAASLHEISKILGGGRLVEEELVPIFEEMIQVHFSGFIHFSFHFFLKKQIL